MIAIADNGVIAPFAVCAGGLPYKPRMDAFHRLKIGVAECRHHFKQSVLFGKRRRRTRRKLVIDRLFPVKRCDMHFEVAPLVALPLGILKRPVHQLLEKRLVAIHKLHFAKRTEKEVSLHFFDLRKACRLTADRIVRHERDAVVVSALAVVKIFAAAEVGTPVGKKLDILPLHPLPHRLQAVRRIMQRDLFSDLFFACFGVQYMAGAVKLQFAVLHSIPLLNV